MERLEILKSYNLYCILHMSNRRIENSNHIILIRQVSISTTELYSQGTSSISTLLNSKLRQLHKILNNETQVRPVISIIVSWIKLSNQLHKYVHPFI